jgi:hypothetical protein
VLDVGVAEELLSVFSDDNSETFSQSPINKENLLRTWNEWKKPVLEKYQKRNERLFDRETDRINRYYDDYALRVEDRISKLEEEKLDVNRRRDNSSDLEERRKLQKRLQDITIALDRLNIEKLKLKQEAAIKREKELKELWDKLELTTMEELIAITHFKLQ